ncbi:unnamed protein product [Paramecium pentaurelia]|uniref:HOOK N-terminal domain-containing protein n=1 Tax=Paramecium pentaurelia TaxID=43138 RepID=A0A8S1SW59_9CILI|nr:unnamed protein product [Paramecium pentaurelia]
MQNQELQSAIVDWMNKISFLKYHTNFKEYIDGTLFIQILNHINTDHFGSTFHVLENQAYTDNWALNMSRLKLIVDKLTDYTHKQLEINVMEIAKDRNETQILKLFGVICQLILQSDFQDDFFVPVLQLPEKKQELISQYLQTLVEPFTQSEDKSLLDKIDELETENQKLIHQHQVLMNEIIEQKMSIKKLEQENKDKTEHIVMLESHERKSSFNEEKIKELEELNKQLWSSQSKTRELEIKVQSQQNQIKEANLLKDNTRLENEQLKLKIMQYIKQEQKYEQTKEKLTQQKLYYTKLIEDKDRQLNKLQTSFQEIFNSFQNEKKRTLQLEAEIQSLQSKITELNHEFHQKEVCLNEKIREASRRESRLNSFEATDLRPDSRMNTNDQINLAQDLNQTNDQYYALHMSMLIQEENYKKEIDILKEKIKNQDQQIKAWKQLNERSEDKIKQLESKTILINDNQSAQHIAQQNEQIKYLTNMLNSFNDKFMKIKEEHMRLLKTCQ